MIMEDGQGVSRSLGYFVASLVSIVLTQACSAEIGDQTEQASTSPDSSTQAPSPSTDSLTSTSSDVGTTQSDDQDLTSSTESTESTDFSSTGTSAVCGNGILEEGEDCDDETSFCNSACIKSRIVFVTSEPPLQAGAIDGLIGADYECRHRAAVMNFPNAERYRAWISSSTVDARDRVEHHTGRYVLVNGLIVAESWDTFASAEHQNPIDVTEQSQTLVVDVWTGTQPDGTRVPAQGHCQDWTSSSALELAYAGDSTLSDANWTINQVINPIGCVSPAALYCIEQP